MSILTKIKEWNNKPEGEGKSSKSWEYALPMGAILVFIVGVLCFAEWWHGWRMTHQPHLFPYEISWRGFVTEIEPVVVSPISGIPVKTEEEIMDSYRLAPILKSIYFLESTAGKNDGCKEEGRFNGFGYAQSDSSWKCYSTFELVVEQVNDWFEERLSTNGNNISEAVCYYNTGVPHQATCEYGQNFMSVIVDRL